MREKKQLYEEVERLYTQVLIAKSRSILEEAIKDVLTIHKPIDAAMYGPRNIHKVQVCTGCGQDDGNWNKWPCPTIRAIQEALT